MSITAEPNLDKKLLHKIIRDYSPLHFSPKLIQLLSSACPREDFSGYNKYELHQRLNDLMLNQYTGEAVLKYALFKTFYKKDNIAAFEIKVNNSRADFLCINGYSSSFEIKSSLDTLYKLSKQASDYIRAFDYNYIVIDKKHLKAAMELVPPSFGIWSYSPKRKKIYREATINEQIDPEIQLKLLTKKERCDGFKEVCGEQKNILKDFTVWEINSRFKKLMKARYQQRWNFVLAHSETILPIDLQFFFNKNVDPAIVYHF
jgi:hypothetical protein